MTKQLNKKGTSLVELIAVIVIMGIIAGIAVPVTIAVINRQKKNAAIKSAENCYAAAETVLTEALATGITGTLNGYVTKTGSGDTEAYNVTSTNLAAKGDIKSDPFATAVTFSILTSAETPAITVSGTFPNKVNGVDVYWNATGKCFQLTAASTTTTTQP